MKHSIWIIGVLFFVFGFATVYSNNVRCGGIQNENSREWGKCIHVYGQNLLVPRGMTPEGVASALGLCDRFGSKEGMQGCANGVFTRFFSQIQNDDSCSRVPSRYQLSCYLELPFLWNLIYQKNYPEMWRLCVGTGIDEYRKSCSRGIGHMVTVVSKFNQSVITEACQSAPSDEFHSLCILEAVRYLRFEKKEGSERLCDDLPGTLRDDCIKESQAW